MGECLNVMVVELLETVRVKENESVLSLSFPGAKLFYIFKDVFIDF